MVCLPLGGLQFHLPCSADQKYSYETNLGDSTLNSREQTDRELITTDQSGGNSQYPGHALVTTTLNPLSVMAIINLRKRWKSSVLKTALTSEINK